jgi:hypothetical protein
MAGEVHSSSCLRLMEARFWRASQSCRSAGGQRLDREVWLLPESGGGLNFIEQFYNIHDMFRTSGVLGIRPPP